MRVSSVSQHNTSHQTLNTQAGAPPLAVALKALKGGTLITKTFFEGAFVQADSELIIRRLFAKNFTLRKTESGRYFFSPPGLRGGKPEVHEELVQKELDEVIGEFRALFSGHSNPNQIEESLLYLKSLILLSSCVNKSSVIIKLINIAGEDQFSHAPLSVKMQLFHLIKYLVITSIKDNTNTNTYFYTTGQSALKILSDNIELLAQARTQQNLKNMAPQIPADELFFCQKAHYELSIAKLFLEKQFPKKANESKEKIAKGLLLGKQVVDAFTGRIEAITNLVKEGVQTGLDTWLQHANDKRLKRAFVIEVYDYFANYAPHFQEENAKHCIDELIKYFPELLDSLSSDDWPLMYGLLDCLQHLALRFPSEVVLGKLSTFLFSKLPDVLPGLMNRVFNSDNLLRVQTGLKMLEMILLLSKNKESGSEFRFALANAVQILDDNKIKSSDLLTITLQDVQKKKLDPKLSTFIRSDVLWLNHLDRLYVDLATHNPTLQESLQGKDAAKIREQILTPVIKGLIRMAMPENPDLYESHFARVLLGIHKGMFIPKQIERAVASSASANRELFRAESLADDASSPPESSDDPTWDISLEDKRVPRENNPFQLPSLALKVLDGALPSPTLERSIFCIQALIDAGVRFSRCPPQTDLLILLGNTSCGKSTTANYLMGLPMRSIPPDENMFRTVYDVDPQGVRGRAYCKIAHTDVSGTFMPQLLATNGPFTICDSAGFSDSRGFEIKIANAANLAMVANKAKSIRIFLHLDSTEFEGARALVLRTNLKNLSEILGSANILKNSLPSMLIAIKNPSVEARKAPYAIKLAAALVDLFTDKQQVDEETKKQQREELKAQLENKIVFVNPTNGEERETLIDMLQGLTPITDTEEAFKAVLDESTSLNLQKITKRLNARVQDLLDKRRYKEAEEYFKGLSFLQHLDPGETAMQMETLRNELHHRVEILVADIRLLIANTTLSRAQLRRKMETLREMAVFGPYLPDQPNLTATFDDFEAQIRTYETTMQNDRNRQIEGNFRALKEQLAAELENKLQAYPAAVETILTSQQPPLHTAESQLHLEVYTPIKNLIEQVEKEIVNRERGYYCRNLIDVRPLLDRERLALNSLTIDACMIAKLDLLKADFATHRDSLEQQIPALVEQHYESFSNELLTPEGLAAKLHLLQQDETACSALIRNLDELGRMQPVERVRREQVAKAWEDHAREVHRILTYLHELARGKKCQVHSDRIGDICANPAQLVGNPSACVTLDKDFRELRRLNEGNYNSLVLALKNALIEGPKAQIKQYLATPSISRYKELIEGQLLLIRAARSLPAAFDVAAMDEEYVATSREISDSETNRHNGEVAEYEGGKQRLLADFSSLASNGLKEKNWDLFARYSPANPQDWIEHNIVRFPNALSPHFLDNLEKAINTQNDRYATYLHPRDLEAIQESLVDELNLFVSFERLKLEFMQAMEEGRCQEKFLTFAMVKTYCPNSFGMIEYLESSRRYPGRNIAAKKGEFEAFAQKEIHLKETKKIGRQIQTACNNKTLHEFSATHKMRELMVYLRDYNNEEYKTTVTTLEDHLRTLQDQDTIHALLQIDQYQPLIIRYAFLERMQKELQGHILLKLTAFEDGLKTRIRELKTLAKREIENITPNDQIFFIPGLKSLMDLIRAFGTKLPSFTPFFQLDELKDNFKNVRRRTVAEWPSLFPFESPQPVPPEIINRVARQVAKLRMVAEQLELTQETMEILNEAMQGWPSKETVNVGKQLEQIQKDSPAAASAIQGIIQTLESLKIFDIGAWNKKAHGVGFAEALQNIVCHPLIRNRSQIERAYASYMAAYSQHIQQIAWGKFDLDAALQGIKGHATRLQKHRREVYRDPETLGHLLGGIFAVWTHSHTTKDAAEGNTDFLLQPHSTQLLAILKLMGTDLTTGSIQNQVAEVLTGQGKSVCLGALASLFALLEFDVNVVCFNPYLSKRDEKLFAPLFDQLNIAHRVTYSGIMELVDSCDTQGLLPRQTDYVRSFLEGKPKAKFEATKNTNKVLLIDEIDVFFGPNFFSKVESRVVILNHKSAKDLIRHIWEERENLSASSLDELLQGPQCEDVRKAYPNLSDSLLKREVKRMLEGIRLFPLNGKPTTDAICQDNKIGFRESETCSINTRISKQDYSTAFAALHFMEKGELTSERTLNDWLGIQISSGGFINSKISDRFELLLGLTGTLKELDNEEKKLLTQYRFTQQAFIPTTFQKIAPVKNVNTTITTSSADHVNAIKNSLRDRVADGRPTLVILENHKKLEEFKNALEKNPGNLPPLEILDEKLEDEKRDEVIIRSTLPGKITLMTKEYGRGTDFICRDDSFRDTGVHVIATFMPETEAEERQYMGRTGRQDATGTFEKILLASDLAGEYGSYTTINDLAKKSKEEIETYLNTQRQKKCEARTKKMMDEAKSNESLHHETMAMVENIGNSNKNPVLAFLEKQG